MSMPEIEDLIGGSVQGNRAADGAVSFDLSGGFRPPSDALESDPLETRWARGDFESVQHERAIGPRGRVAHTALRRPLGSRM